MRGSRRLGLAALLLAAGCNGKRANSQDAAQPTPDTGADAGGDAAGAGADDVRDTGENDPGAVDRGQDLGAAPDAGADADADARADVRDAGTGEGGGLDSVDRADVPGCVAALSVGSSHACALRTDGTMWCWGSNTNGEIGTGTSNTTSILIPTQVTALGAGVVQVSVGTGFYSCATLNDGKAWCWGVNSFGQLGLGGTVEQRAPVQVQAPGGAYAAIAAGSVSTCARTEDGRAWCWGQGPTGHDQSTPITTPSQMTALGDRTRDIGVGGGEACALLSDATVWCWGMNNAGQLGIGNFTDSLVPVQVTSLGATVAALAVGLGHACALQADHTLWCWGVDEDGQLGDGISGFGARSPTPKQVTALPAGVLEVAGHGRHTCARLADRSVWCWGYNMHGEVGDGTTMPRAQPVPVVGLPPAITLLSAGYYLTCAVSAGKSAWCWGYNYAGQLGDGTTTTRLQPVRVQLPCP